MKRFWIIVGSVVLSLMTHGAEGQPSADPPYFVRQQLTLEIKGWPYRDGRREDHGELCVDESGLKVCRPAGKTYYSLHFVMDGKHLRARVLSEDLLPSEELIDVSREKVLEKNGWYVTADYSTNPPQVLLTKEPTQYSQWSIFPSRGGQAFGFRNENDLKKDAYLKPADAGFRDAPADACRPVLTPEKSYWDIAAYNIPRKNKPHWLDHKMSYGGFDVFDKVEPSSPPRPKFYNLHYFWDGTHVRVRLKHDREQSKEEAGWYLTADRSVTPPRVILTKEPTQDSRWSFVAPAPTQRWRYYIKNENDLGKERWLDVVDTGNGVSKAILTVHNKKVFEVRDIEEDGGK